MIIVFYNWKKKLFQVLTVVALVVALAFMTKLFAGSLCERIPVFSGWFQEEHPSGNPMRVENIESSTAFDDMLDKFVIKLQDFYYEK